MVRYGWLLATLLAGCSTEKSLKAACAAGDPGACDVLAARYAYGDGVPKDEALSAELGARAMALCADGGTSPRCPVRVVKSVPLDQPRPPADVQTLFTVTLSADGAAQVDGKPLANDDAILAAAKAAREHDPDVRATIKADVAVPHGRVIHVLDLLKQAQISKIAFGVQPVAR